MVVGSWVGCWEGVERDGQDVDNGVCFQYVMQIDKSVIVTLVAQSIYELSPPGLWDGVDVIPSLPGLLAPDCMAQYWIEHPRDQATTEDRSSAGNIVSCDNNTGMLKDV